MEVQGLENKTEENRRKLVDFFVRFQESFEVLMGGEEEDE
jgi:hypothetical protein